MSSISVSANKKEAFQVLKQADYSVYENVSSNLEMCFELFAHHYSPYLPSLLIKIVENIDIIKPYFIHELKFLSRFLTALPLIIGIENRHDFLQDNCLFLRKGLISININTFSQIILNNQLPLAVAKKGGFFVDIDGEKLIQLRKRKNYTRNDLAEKLNVSAKSIMQYENNEMRTSREHAQRLEEILGESIQVPLNIFAYMKKSFGDLSINPNLQKKTSAKTRELMKTINEIVTDRGYQTYWTRTSPFDLFIYRESDDSSKIEDYTLIGGTMSDKKYQKPTHETKINFLKNTKNAPGIMIYDDESIDEKQVKQEKVPYIVIKELKELENPKEFKKLIKKRKN
ncbi:MAG: helix-turn-helix domain-containing protein [Promethearchaeota archaeon]